MLSDTGFIERHRLIDVMGRLSLAITSSRDIADRLSFSRMHTEFFFPSARTFYGRDSRLCRQRSCVTDTPTSGIVLVNAWTNFSLRVYSLIL